MATLLCGALMAAGCASGRFVEAGSRAAGPGPRVDIDVQAVTTPVPGLRVTMTNLSGEPLELFEYNLPWRGTYNDMKVVALKLDAEGSVLHPDLVIDDPGPQTVTLRPRETLSGILPLTFRFPHFIEELASRDIVVFWTCQLRPIGQNPLPRAGGYVVFPRPATGAPVGSVNPVRLPARVEERASPPAPGAG